MPLITIINDVSERHHLREIKNFLSKIEWQDGYEWELADASGIRKKVFNHIETDVKNNGKYDLVLVGLTGGRMFDGRALKRYSERIRRLPYSMHAESVDWKMALRRELLKIGDTPQIRAMRALWHEKPAPQTKENPRILLLEGDMGRLLHTADKMQDVRQEIASVLPSANIHVVGGVAHELALALSKPVPEYVAHRTSTDVLRLSEIINKEHNMWTDREKDAEKGFSCHDKSEINTRLKELEFLQRISKHHGLRELTGARRMRRSK